MPDVPCFNCGRAVDLELHRCPGCGAVVCESCDRNISLPPLHHRDDHLVESVENAED